MTKTDYDAWAWLYDRTLGPAYRDLKMGFLDRVLLGELPAGAKVLDLCCGTGQMMAPVIARGFDVTGLDMSADMLRHAAINAPGAVLVQGDARDFDLNQRFSGVICASASLNHMADLDELTRVFRAVHAALEDGGSFVFDINHPEQMIRHWQGRPSAGEIAADYAWLITPRYDPRSATGAFRVDMYRRPAGAGPAANPLWRRLLGRPVLRRQRLRLLERFGAAHPDWDHRGVDYPIHGHNLADVGARLTQCGFDVRLETLSGQGAVDADSAACFVCRKQAPEFRQEAAE